MHVGNKNKILTGERIWKVLSIPNLTFRPGRTTRPWATALPPSLDTAVPWEKKHERNILGCEPPQIRVANQDDIAFFFWFGDLYKASFSSVAGRGNPKVSFVWFVWHKKIAHLYVCMWFKLCFGGLDNCVTSAFFGRHLEVSKLCSVCPPLLLRETATGAGCRFGRMTSESGVLEGRSVWSRNSVIFFLAKLQDIIDLIPWRWIWCWCVDVWYVSPPDSWWESMVGLRIKSVHSWRFVHYCPVCLIVLRRWILLRFFAWRLHLFESFSRLICWTTINTSSNVTANSG